MCELLSSIEIVIETPNNTNQSNLELTISVTHTPLHMTLLSVVLNYTSVLTDVN
jgi:hypothetical protein